MNKTSLLAIGLALLAIGCGSPEAEKTAPPPSGMKAATGSIKVAAFQGGYGIDFYQATAKEFEAKHPGTKITVEGDPRIWEKLRPQLIGGTPPDLMFPGWGMDHWALVADGQLLDLNKALDSQAEEGGREWRDTFDPNLLKLGQQDGKQYVLPYYCMVLGWWYDPGLFAKNGWTPPKTYEELLELCAKIKAKGIAPITFQGKYPYYMIEGMLLPWAISVGGMDVVTDAQNLVPGAWKSPAILQSAKMIRSLQDQGFFQKGATALSHTESQTEFLNGRAAMIPCGTWLYSEMKNVMPPGAAMDFFLPPILKAGKGDPSSVLIGIEPWMVPSKAKNPDGAIALFKYMTSLTKAKQFVEQKGTLMAITGSDQVKLPDVLVKPAKALKESKSVWAAQYRQWYPAFQTEIENALTAMLNGELTPEGFCDRCEAAAEKTRKDDSIKKHKVAG